MLPKSLLALSFLLARGLAQSTATATATATQDDAEVSTTADATPTAKETESGTSTSKGVTTHTIAVGASGHKFSPDKVEADVGDVIEWRFYPPNHWVIRGDYDNPCIPYEYVGIDRVGFSSGQQEVQAITDDGPRFRVRVNNTDPIFYYCGAPGSCVRYHMMGVINESKNETLEKWDKKADGVDYQLRPGDPWPSEADYTKPTDAVSSETGSSSNDTSDNNGSNGLGAGAIAGIAIGAAAVLLLGGGLLYLCGRRGGFDKAYRKSFRNSTAPTYASAPGMGETPRFDSPSTAAASMWNGHKQPSPMSAYAHSEPMSPQNTAGYNNFQGFNPMAQGTMGSYYGDQVQTPQHQQHLAVPHQLDTIKPAEPPAPVELPGSHEPSRPSAPVPDYDNPQTEQTPRVFSWAGEETAYHPPK